MTILKRKLFNKIEQAQDELREVLDRYGSVKIDSVTVAQVIGGMRGIKSLISDISYLDPEEGIRFRGLSIAEMIAALPKPPGQKMPYVEGLFYLLLMNEIPTENDVRQLIDEFETRAAVPMYVYEVLRAMPRDTSPMTMFATAVLAMQRESQFAEAYARGVGKRDYWETYLEDTLNLLPKLAGIGAYIYRMKYKSDTPLVRQSGLDFGASFAQQMGIKSPYDEVSRLYFCLHADHEAGNVSAHTTLLVASALSDPYLSLSAGLNGLAGPLHGRANQEVLRWTEGLLTSLGCGIPSKEKPATKCTLDDIERACRDTLGSGQVIPGFGHAVLRKTDPRYTALLEFAKEHFPDYYLVIINEQLLKVVPRVLMETGKVKNPWPNVDCISGVIQSYYGVTEYDFYPVLFGIGRAFGVLANIMWNRALGFPLERPKSVTTALLRSLAENVSRTS